MTSNQDKEINYKQGIVFGVFDGLHLGHEYFLKEAAKRCDKLIVVVTQSKIVELLKNHQPKYSLFDRISKIKEYDKNFEVVPGDLILGTWSVLQKYPTGVVFLGHDQQSISEELEKINVLYFFIESYHPEKYKSSIL